MHIQLRVSHLEINFFFYIQTKEIYCTLRIFIDIECGIQYPHNYRE